jgi:hypothetical protein
MNDLPSEARGCAVPKEEETLLSEHFEEKGRHVVNYARGRNSIFVSYYWSHIGIFWVQHEQ